MPGVSPSDGGYNYYRQAVEDLENEYQSQAKRAKEKEEARLTKAEERATARLRRSEEETQKTINNIKENANEEMAIQRANQNEETERLKAQTYDRFGRYNGLEAEELEEQLREVKSALEAELQKNKETSKDTEKRFEERLDDVHKGYQKKIRDEVESTRESANAAYDQIKKNQKEVYTDEKRKGLEAYNKLAEDQAIARKHEQAETDRAVASMQKDFQHELDQAKSLNDTHNASRQRAFDKKTAKETKDLSESHSKETGVLREQLKNLIEAESQYVKEKGQGADDAIRDNEDDWRNKFTLAQESYERVINNLKDKADKIDKYYATLSNQAIKEKDANAAKILSTQITESHLNQKQTEETFDREIQTMQKRVKQDRENSRAQLSEQLEIASKERKESLENQAAAYQRTLKQNSVNNNEEIGRLQKELTTRKVSSDISLISPAQEAAIRKSINEQYEKLSSANEKRTNDRTEHMQREYAQKMRTTVADHNADTAERIQKETAERQQERAQLLQAIKDTEAAKESTIRGKKLDYELETDKMYHIYATMLDRQRRQYDEIFQTQRNEAQTRLQTMRQELEFSSRMAQRESSNRQNDLVRDFEKKLQNQKTDYEALIYEVKAQADQQTREVERRTKQSIEDLTRGYEQKISQLEIQHKERERYISQNYEDSLDKLKASNAMLVKRKA